MAAPAATPPESGFFCRCTDPTCGLRFPVVPGDSFLGRCPACGGEVIRVAAATPAPMPTPGAPGGPRLRLLLDNWRSLFNVGSAFRTADGAGVEHLYLCGITATPAHAKLTKTALGAERAVAWSYHPDAVLLADELRRSDAVLWALEAHPAAVSLFAVGGDLAAVGDRPLVLVAGNEVAGVDPGLMACVERMIAVPMMGRKESLNVAVALSVAVYWLRGQLG